MLLTGEQQALDDAEWYCYKPCWGPFYGTRLLEHLQRINVYTVVIVGCNYSNCVRATVYEVSARDLRMVAIKEGISNFTSAGWQELASIGINVMTLQECIGGVSN